MKKDGFTLIELIITLAILGLILAIAAPNYLGVSAATGEQACAHQRTLIKKALREQMAQQADADPKVLLEQILANEDGRYFTDSPVCPSGGSYKIVELNSGEYGVACSLHGAPEGAIAFNGYQYDFSRMNKEEWSDIAKIGKGTFNYNEETGKVVSNWGTAFIQYDQSDHYKLTTSAKLSENSNGYGLFLETSLNDPKANNEAPDTGTIIQFDPGLGTMIAMRKRDNGNEGTHTSINIAKFIKEADYAKDENGEYLIQSDSNGKEKKVRSDWWKSEHTMSLEVETIDENTKGVKVYIDDVAIFNDDEYSYTINTNTEEKTYTGFRTWSGDVEFSSLTYENLD